MFNYLLNISNHNDFQYEVSVVYFRAGYAPTDYPSEAVRIFDWILELQRISSEIFPVILIIYC